jgi:hypothetical protein
MEKARLSTLSVVRFTDFVTKWSRLPSDESLGYYQSSANADENLNTFFVQGLLF